MSAPTTPPAMKAKSARELQRNINGVVVLAAMAAERGMVLRQFLAASGLRKADLDDPTTMVSFEQEFQLIRNLLAYCGDAPGLGFESARYYGLTSLTAVGFVLISSPTLREAFDHFVSYADLNATMLRTVANSEGSDLRMAFRISGIPQDVQRFLIERASAVALKLSRELLGYRVIPKAVDFTFARPASVSQYRLFAGLLPTFGLQENALVFMRDDADRLLLRANPLALRMAEDYCSQLLVAWKARTGFALTVRDRIARTLTNIPDMNHMASELAMSGRTMRRRLEVEGTSYGELCDEVREALAEELLAIARLPIDHIAERLGYSEAASFIHAFKRWKGQTPRQFRAGLARQLI